MLLQENIVWKNEKWACLSKLLKWCKKLDEEDFYFIDAKLKCPNDNCKKEFGIDREYMGVVTCPYCGEYVEGM